MPPKQQAAADLGRVVVIGGNGFLGHHIVNQALSPPSKSPAHQWTATSVSSIDLRCDRNRNPDAAYYECDITDTARLVSLFEDIRPDVVIHTASPVSDGRGNKDLFRKVNVDGTASVVEAAKKAGIKALVYTSSSSVVSDNKSDLVNVDERWPMVRGADQSDYYSETKAQAETIVIEANRKDGSSFLTTALRPAGIFGEGDVQNLAGIMKAYNEGKTNVQIGENNNIFDFTYVGNVAHAHLLAAHLLLATAAASTQPLDYEKADGEVFFITNDCPVYFWDYTTAIWRAAGKKDGRDNTWTLSKDVAYFFSIGSELFAKLKGSPATFSRSRVVYMCMTRYFNINKAKRVLRYNPVWTLQQGIDRGVKWFQDQEKKGTGKAQ